MLGEKVVRKVCQLNPILHLGMWPDTRRADVWDCVELIPFSFFWVAFGQSLVSLARSAQEGLPAHVLLLRSSPDQSFLTKFCRHILASQLPPLTLVRFANSSFYSVSCRKSGISFLNQVYRKDLRTSFGAGSERLKGSD